MRPFDHPGLLYRDVDEFLAATVPFVRAAVDAGDPVLVAVPGEKHGLIREALAGAGDRVEFADMAVNGRNPGRILPAVLLPFAAAHPGRRVAIVGEPLWPGRTATERAACAVHEALINAAFEGREASVLCPYDAARLDPATVAEAWRTHPEMIDGGERVPSGDYRDPLLVAEAVNVPLPPPPAGAAVLAYARSKDLAEVRAFVRRRAGVLLGDERSRELVLAVHELATNTIRHAGGPGTITVWTEPGLLVCQVDDGGHIGDPLAGRRLPPPSGPSGRGLLLVNQLCDLVRLRSGPEGTSVRLQMLLT
ncbi:sensor histidine kinase [Actinoplanes subtropicus]|uniref:sensor histidine kinase n=1 Tax=Actinoplanes subtropicus TaxID=543632 RepID=UPI0004C3D2DB|nr:sensor histidine kinase [Actinoplanes subtropicus]